MTAYEEWVDRVTHDGRHPSRDDRPDISVHCPRSLPGFSLQTRTIVPPGGTLCHDAWEVIDGDPVVLLHLAGVRISGPLADIKLLLAAAVEVLDEAQGIADSIKAQQSVREFTDLVAPRSAVTP